MAKTMEEIPIENKNTHMTYWKQPEDSELILSAAYGDSERMIKAICSECDINQRNSLGEPAIVIASYMGNVDCLKILLDNNADVNIQTIDKGGTFVFGQTPLMQAIRCLSAKHIETALQISKMLISAGAHLDVLNSKGISALYMAVKEDQTKIVRQLLLAGANINIEHNRKRHTPIMLAAQRAAIRSLDVLLEFKADVNYKDRNADTPLTLAVQLDDLENWDRDDTADRVQCVQRLVDEGIDVNAANQQRQNALFILSQQSMTRCAVEILKVLLRAGAEVNKYVYFNCIECFFQKNKHLGSKKEFYFIFLKLLFIAGEKCEVAYENQVKKALVASGQCISDGSLRHLCRAEIRSVLVQRQKKNLFWTVPLLPLPLYLIRLLLYLEEL